ncbi:hypothetical protein [Mesorhizobium sp.]|uniref:hypothetical protein n=1 Tax=Mesorhizobium sp. TaxID=1871066 RepID=UPI00121E10FD|nr:hypothetical protein [Mesorhizobium sp.]TIV59103.1 MAG: hypothetical protein E5V80_15505 [Mesorhizobium sp.]
MQPQSPDMFISLLPMLIIYGIASAFALRKRKEQKAELTRAEGWRRWRKMNLYLFGAITLAAVSVWLKSNGITR